MKELYKSIVWFVLYLLGLFLAFYWYDWKLALILFLLIGVVNASLEDFKRELHDHSL